MTRGISLKLLLDTHAFIWLALDWSKIPPPLFETLDKEVGNFFISAISAVEIGLLVNSGKVSIPCSCEFFLSRNIDHYGVQQIPVDVEVALASTQLPPIHRDPFDRIIIATALEHGMTILTKDRTIPMRQRKCRYCGMPATDLAATALHRGRL